MPTFDADPADWFEERGRQLVGWGIPERSVRRARAAVDDAWREGPGGWPFEWTRLAQEAEGRRRWGEAAACYGAARFPCAVTPLRERAAERQLDCFLRASRSFPCRFERRTLELELREGTVRVPVHVYGGAPCRPLVLLSGGVDTYKIELHRMALLIARLGGFAVVAFDMPGTGESPIALAPDADRLHRALIAALRSERPSGARIGMVGVSFGGHWSAKLALDGAALDAAVDLGGPVGALPDEDDRELSALPNGMTGIVAHAMRLDALPDEEAARALLRAFSLREHLEGPLRAPLLVVNGADDPYVPAADSEVFRALDGATVWRVEGCGHCAAERLPRVLPAVIGWLRMRLHGGGAADRLLDGAARRLLPRLVGGRAP